MTVDKKHKDIDKFSGIETTGHEWDGIKELNQPAPRWWLWVFFICCIWAFGYWVIYPAWPTLSGEGFRGGTLGQSGKTQYTKLEESEAEITARKAAYLDRFGNKSLQEIADDPELYEFAIAGGKASFKDNCATCHGTGGAGGRGYPNLNDDDWLWGGTLEDIYSTISNGIRSTHADTRISEMPAFSGMLSAQQIADVAEHVLSLSGKSPANEAGAVVFSENCASCHGVDGKGGRSVGAPNLADAIWFYSAGDKASIVAQIRKPKHGVMPTWNGRLDEDTIRQLTIYVHSLGGGE